MKATRANRVNLREPVKLQAGGYYWAALDDGYSFQVRDWLGTGPHLVRLDHADGEWTAAMLDRFRGHIEIGADLDRRVVRAMWPANSLMGQTLEGQDVRITWLAGIGDPPALPADIEPVPPAR